MGLKKIPYFQEVKDWVSNNTLESKTVQNYSDLTTYNITPPAQRYVVNEDEYVLFFDSNLRAWKTISDYSIVASSIPDLVVTRAKDNNTISNSNKRGIEIHTKTQWQSIGARLSSNVSGVSKAEIIEISTGNILQTVNISGLSSGDTFTFDNVELESGKNYSIIAWDEGNGHNSGTNNTSDTYTSDDLDIVGGIRQGTVSADYSNIVEVGNIGFSY